MLREEVSERKKKNSCCNINIQQCFEFKHPNLYTGVLHRMWVEFHLNVVTIGFGFVYLLVLNGDGN